MMRFVLLATIAVLALTGCSPSTYSDAISSVSVDGASFVALSDQNNVYVSDDGGRTWDFASNVRIPPEQTSQCVPKNGSRCYQVVDGALRVLQSDDGGETWRTSWQVPQGRMRMLERSLDTRPESMSLAIQATAGGHVVVVANGSDGIAVRDENGDWRRYGLGDDGLSEAAAVPLDSSGPIGQEAWTAILVGAWTLIAGFAIAVRTYRRGSLTGLAIAGLLSTILGTAAGFGDPFAAVIGGVFSLTTLGLLIGAWVTAHQARIDKRTMGTVVGGGILAAIGVLGPFRAWSEGWFDSYNRAILLALVLGLAFTASGLAMVRRTALNQSARELQ